MYKTKNRSYVLFLILLVLCFTQIFSFGFNLISAENEIIQEMESSLPLTQINTKDETASCAKAMAVIEKDSGRLLYQKNSSEKLAMASTTKIMTALVALKNCKDLDEIFKVDDRAVGIEGTSLYLHKNEEKSVRELLYGVMLPSGNDASVAIACKIAGSEEEFCKLMNDEAKKIGALNTNFINAHGLDEEGHYTTAYDLALITAEAMKNETFKEIVSTQKIKVSGNEEVAGKFLKNKNRLLWSVEGCNGVKTGFTDNAGRCFVCSIEKNGMTLICVVLNCGPMFEEAEKLLFTAFEKYKLYELLSAYSPCQEVLVTKGVEKSVDTMTRKKNSYPLTLEEYEKIEYEINLLDKIEAPIEKEQIVGEINIKLDNCLLFNEKIYTINDVESTKFFDKLEKVIDYWNI